MTDTCDDFEYAAQVEIPKIFRRVDTTFIACRDKPFAAAEAALRTLSTELYDSFSGSLFAQLHFLRAIEDRILSLAVDTRQPLEVCLGILRQRLDLEYNRSDVFGKAAKAVELARYANGSGFKKMAIYLLTAEMRDLKELSDICRSWMATIADHIRQIDQAAMEE